MCVMEEEDGGGILVADSLNHRVVRWTPGAAHGSVVAGGVGKLPLQGPLGVEVVRGRLLVADNGDCIEFMSHFK